MFGCKASLTPDVLLAAPSPGRDAQIARPRVGIGFASGRWAVVPPPRSSRRRPSIGQLPRKWRIRMRRPFDFSSIAQSQARLRQEGMCACCDASLDDLEECAHHVVPNQSGVSGDPRHAWLTSADNCVILCAVCHDRVHENGRYRNGAVAPPSYFAHSHGRNRAAHRVWSKAMADRARTVWR